jgi:DNA-directed RNA polymerase beta subunit
MTTNLRPILEDSATRREAIRAKAIEGLSQAFPLKAGKHTLEVSNVRVEPKEYSSREQKRAILEGRTLSERVRGDVVVKNAAGEVTSHARDFTLLQLPYFTPRHTFIVDGTEYSVSNQIRTKPGAYVRRRGNEDLEASFTLSKGANFRVSMEPDKGLLYMQPSHTTSKIPLHPVLRALGVPHQDIAAAFTRHAQREANHIEIDVEGGVITLTGEVDSLAEHDAAIGTAYAAKGVTRVIDRLHIGALGRPARRLMQINAPASLLPTLQSWPGESRSIGVSIGPAACASTWQALQPIHH